MVNASPENAITRHISPLPNLPQFTLAELKGATKNFGSDSLLGEGGFGQVFKGRINDKPSSKTRKGSGTPVAVKRMNSDGFQGIEEWLAEVNFLGRLSHPNLVKLLGYCIEDGELLLLILFQVQTYIDEGDAGEGALPWDIRFKIVIGMAKGLAFLLTSEMQVIHRDIKTSNILLDGFYNAKISDFGLAKVGPSESKSYVTTSVMGTCGLAKTSPSESKSHVTTRVMGTYGFADPEYVSTGHLYVKSDVYGFGVVLVEILTGLRAIDPRRPRGQEILVDWMKPFLTNKRKLKSCMDSRLEGKYPHLAVYKIAQLALNCLALEPNCRPSMEKVVKTLEELESSHPKMTTEPKFRPTCLGP
ncbi:hypothetical protein CRG98_011817 [Punica granatum]|uniref:non-specific serine/threonine protein kinase n=1 Tax=Punica granatum TaxID=22663 RepID=A0A2I0KGW6_PUNGR|nr:hypothetical protein CRG98_011817 [Punica granatum]